MEEGNTTKQAKVLWDIVNLSPLAVKSGSTKQWVEAFSPDGTVEDPNGSFTHRGNEALTVFNQALIQVSLQYIVCWVRFI
jgi:hypothetical protein